MSGVGGMPIDVLAVMAELWSMTRRHETYFLPVVDEARAAVAELIEAAIEMNRLAKGPAGGVSQAEKRAIVNRMEAALANVTGGGA